MLWSCFSSSGRGKFHVIEGKMTSGNSTTKYASICKVAEIATRMDVSARQ